MEVHGSAQWRAIFKLFPVRRCPPTIPFYVAVERCAAIGNGGSVLFFFFFWKQSITSKETTKIQIILQNRKQKERGGFSRTGEGALGTNKEATNLSFKNGKKDMTN